MHYLSPENQLFLFSAVLLLIASSVAFVKEKEKLTLHFLFGGAFLLRMFIITIDPFLNNWDERFHALVAKNMMDHPFKPMLHNDPAIPYHYTDWTNNYIWLHKQPVFLWQMAMSMKLFGVNEIAMRLPSVLMGAIQTIFIYRIGKLVLNRETGFIAALLFSCSYFQLQQTCGMFGMDHNDVAFGFYVTASIWSLFELRRSGKFYWVILIGLSAGLAILNKWLTGLLVYAGWGLIILADKEKRFSIKGYKEIAIAFVITCLTFLPWQIYIANAFPVESNFELNYNSEHITTAVEGHKGQNTFYINKFTKEQYGYWAIAPFLLGVFAIARKKIRMNESILLFAPIALIYIFFSFIVATKITGYVFVVASLVYITITAGFYWLSKLISKFRFRLVIITIFIATICYFNLSFNNIITLHYKAVTQVNREVKINNTEVYKQLNDLVPEDYVVFNVPFYEHVDAMFYSDRNVYQWWPTESEYHYLKSNGRKIAAFREHHAVKMPQYIQNDPEIMMLDFELK